MKLTVASLVVTLATSVQVTKFVVYCSRYVANWSPPMFWPACSRSAAADTFVVVAAVLMNPVVAVIATWPQLAWSITPPPLMPAAVRASTTPTNTLWPACTRMFPPRLCNVAVPLIV